MKIGHPAEKPAPAATAPGHAVAETARASAPGRAVSEAAHAAAPGQAVAAAAHARKLAAAAPATPATATTPATRAAPDPSATVELSSTASTLLSGGVDADFDADKVAQISQAIADGSFKVDPQAIADKLIANAQELLTKVQS
jgi:negative regulator of flagellin synthesis FlgM